jgi:hypothetical protein
MKFLVTILAFVLGTSAFAGPVPTSSDEFQWNRFWGPAALATLAGTKLREAHNTAVGVYDFATAGGAIGERPVGLTLPNGAIIRNVFIETLTAPTSGGAATIAFRAQSAADLLGATAIASFTGRQQGVPNGAVANMIKLTAARTVTATVATAALTGGRIAIYIDYVLGQ